MADEERTENNTQRGISRIARAEETFFLETP